MTPFKQKLRAYVQYAVEDGPYYQQFGANTITVAYATTAGENRLRTMLLWCEQELSVNCGWGFSTNSGLGAARSAGSLRVQRHT
jgi:hypothetical protein